MPLRPGSQSLVSVIMGHQCQYEFPVQEPPRLLQGISFIEQRNKTIVGAHYFRGFLNSLDCVK